MKAILLSIGDELALGQTVNTNSAWISQRLAEIGWAVSAHITVPDDQPAIEQAILESVGRCDALILSGGIGPTEDDLTRQALAAVMDVPLELDAEWLKRLEDFFQGINRDMPAMNRIQAMIPRGAKRIENTAGTAAGIDATYQSGDLKTTCRVFVMPGVPKEMKIMFERDVLPHLKSSGDGGVILSRTLHTFGWGESTVAEKLGDLMRRDRNPSVGTTVSAGIVSLRINSRFADPAQAADALEATVDACRKALGEVIFGQDDQTLPEAVGERLLEHAKANPGFHIATAESCTGGLIAKMLTDLPGSANYFLQGWVTYAETAKIQQLGVTPQTITQFGIISEQVAKAMAQGAQKRAGATIGLGITGLAGPTGATPQTPVGTVCISLASDKQTESRTFHFTGDREMVRDRAAKAALVWLRFAIEGKRLPF